MRPPRGGGSFRGRGGRDGGGRGGGGRFGNGGRGGGRFGGFRDEGPPSEVVGSLSIHLVDSYSGFVLLIACLPTKQINLSTKLSVFVPSFEIDERLLQKFDKRRFWDFQLMN